jgi:hypothetical protein
MTGLWRSPGFLAVWRGRCVLIHDAGEAADEAQVSPRQKMGAAQDDLRAGSGFAIPETPSAGR